RSARRWNRALRRPSDRGAGWRLSGVVLAALTSDARSGPLLRQPPTGRPAPIDALATALPGLTRNPPFAAEDGPAGRHPGQARARGRRRGWLYSIGRCAAACRRGIAVIYCAQGRRSLLEDDTK